jgi:hypothetical protein
VLEEAAFTGLGENPFNPIKDIKTTANPRAIIPEEDLK